MLNFASCEKSPVSSQQQETDNKNERNCSHIDDRILLCMKNKHHQRKQSYEIVYRKIQKRHNWCHQWI